MTLPGRFAPQERDPIPIAKEARWVTKPVWMGAEILTSNGIRSQTVQHIASIYSD
jgi:hypothetical protein